MIPSVNFHLWEPCNMRCKFCFATFQDVKKTILPKGHLPKEQAIEVVKELAQFGFEKITFAGGEPTLCPWLDELILTAKSYGMTTMIVTNGSRLTPKFLERNREILDWIALSVDSLSSDTNLKLGRAISGKKDIGLDDYLSMIQLIKEYGYGLKINTVVNRYNLDEDFTELIQFAQPKRWKVLQVMPVNGQNDTKVDELTISLADFESFVNRHQSLEQITTLVPESCELIRGSYAMVDPAGRFFDSSRGEHFYSELILTVGVEKAFHQISIDKSKFEDRGGNYEWVK
ncbi:MAG: radical SAM protein [Fluviicola sp.]|nr:radical SAM protein [Fluviicola sp.]